MPVIPDFKIYSSLGVLLYTFDTIWDANYPEEPIEFIEHSNIRGVGAIEITGGEAPWDLTMKGTIIGTDYEDLTSKIDTMVSTIVKGTPYILKIHKTVSTYYEYHVKRIQTIKFPIGEDMRTNYTDFEITFRVNSW